MNQTAPQRALDAFEQGVMVVDERGFVRLLNRAAGEQLGVDPELCLGARCWKVARLQSLDGGPFCRSDCGIQQQARAGTLGPSTRARRRSRNGSGQELDICTILVSPQHDRRFALMHILSLAGNGSGRPRAFSADPQSARLDPCTERCSHDDAECATGNAAHVPGLRDSAAAPLEPCAHPGALERLTEREEEVLHLMAEGFDTDAISRHLGICPTTVRNHVQRILMKLHVHGRLPAVLLWLLHHTSPGGSPD